MIIKIVFDRFGLNYIKCFIITLITLYNNKILKFIFSFFINKILKSLLIS